MSALTVIEFDDITEHIFDSSKIILLNDKAQLKNQADSNEVLFFNFDTDFNSKRGSKVFTPGGTGGNPTVSGGFLNLTGNNNSFAKIASLTDIVSNFAFRFKLKVNFTSIVPNMEVLNIKSNVDSSSVRIYLQNQGAGVTRVRYKQANANGTSGGDFILGTKAFAIGDTVDIAFSIDKLGLFRGLYEGVITSSAAPTDGDFSDCSVVFGDEATGNVDYSIDDFQLWKSDFFPSGFAGYTVPLPEPTDYDKNENIIFTVLPFLVETVSLFQIIADMPMNTQLKHFLTINQIDYYHDGTNWVASNRTLAQTNTESEVSSNLSTLPITVGIGAYLQIGHILKSVDGYATPLLESLTTKYNFPFKPDEVKACIVYGTVRDNAKNVIAGATVEVQSKDKFYSGSFIGPKAITTTNAQGKWSMSVVETQTSNTTVDFLIKYLEDGEEVEFSYKNRIVPDFPTKKLSDLLQPA